MTTTRNWSAFQQAIFAKVADPLSGSLLISAAAGSGKSSTMVEALKYAPAGASSVFCAFNKSIASELAAKGVNARTFHSICYSPALRASEQKTVTVDKLRQLVRAWPRERAMLYGNAAQKLVGLARNDGVGCLVPDTDNAWLNLIERHDVAPDSAQGDEAGLIAAARTLLHECNASPLVDFDDMLFRIVRDAIPLPRFDLVIVDENQDSNAVQRAIVRKMLTPTGRLIAVGDSAQSIYAFRGASSDSMELTRRDFNCTEMPLTISYRCAKRIVEYAKPYGRIDASPSAPEGQVIPHGTEWKLSDIGATDMILCRTNAPIVKLAYRLIMARIPCHIKGREIGAGLVSLVNKLQPKGIDGLITKLDAWLDREVSKLHARDASESQVAAVTDKAECIKMLVDSLPENSRTVPELCRTIENMFIEGSGIVLSSVHKAKGLEADAVWILNRDKMPAKWAKTPEDQQQELNILYVAITRAKTTLHLIEE